MDQVDATMLSVNTSEVAWTHSTSYEHISGGVYAVYSDVTCRATTHLMHRQFYMCASHISTASQPHRSEVSSVYLWQGGKSQKGRTYKGNELTRDGRGIQLRLHCQFTLHRSCVQRRAINMFTSQKFLPVTYPSAFSKTSRVSGIYLWEGNTETNVSILDVMATPFLQLLRKQCELLWHKAMSSVVWLEAFGISSCRDCWTRWKVLTQLRLTCNSWAMLF